MKCETVEAVEAMENAKALMKEWEVELLQPVADNLPAACLEALIGHDPVDQSYFDSIDLKLTAIDVWTRTLFHGSWNAEEHEGEHHERGLYYRAMMGHHDMDDTDLATFWFFESTKLQKGAQFVTSSGLVGFFNDISLLDEYPKASICLFQGFPVPFILGGGPEEYRLLGPCYLYPFMTHEPKFEYRGWIKLI
ncbi:hypothetical protein QBC35DRAFT_466348 [Podospora australis]|uniref:Uncharacterized protein n=1 Tax=Podospora australis TaxID=1536484 RepID=A0AAN7AG48_9PEZI|nr:hypothetical protein QBC35DRAFT_466348 [Podospora australis]